MPEPPKKPCSKVGCASLTRGRYCDAHQKEVHQRYDRERGTAAQRGYDGRWRKARKGFLEKHQLCKECEREGTIGAATVVDHIKPHKGDRILFWDRSNWQPLCKIHHDRKTATEEGGFGNG